MRLHLISFDSPYPPNYGGVVDVYNKIRILKLLGCEIILHIFYKKKLTEESVNHLKKISQEVYFYKRSGSILNIFNHLPYIVKSRSSFHLLKNLNLDQAPILFEGLHTCFFLNHYDLRTRKKIVRMHNIEWKYYEALALSESKAFKKLFFAIESLKLKNFEPSINEADNILSISKDDNQYLKEKYAKADTCFIPPFHFTDEYESKSPRGNYILFQGDLSISDTENVLITMVQQVLSKLEIPVIIAGKNPGNSLKKELKSLKNIQLIANPKESEMQDLLEKSHIVLVYSGVKAGMKLKLINGLFQGRFIIGDANSILNTGAENMCHIENNYDHLIDIIKQYWEKDYTPGMNKERAEFLSENFSNVENGRRLLKLIE